MEEFELLTRTVIQNCGPRLIAVGVSGSPAAIWFMAPARKPQLSSLGHLGIKALERILKSLVIVREHHRTILRRRISVQGL